MCEVKHHSRLLISHMYFFFCGTMPKFILFVLLCIMMFEVKLETTVPSSENVITVKAKNNKGEDPPRYTKATTTKESVHESVVPLMPPVGLKTYVLSPTTIILTWRDTTLGNNQMVQDNRYYTVRYRVVTNVESENSRYWYLNSTDLNSYIDSLRPNTKYEFNVKVIKGLRQSPWSMKETNKTQEAAPGSPPLHLTPVPNENDPRAIIMTWQPPAKPNGQITGYLVFYTTDAKQELREWVVDRVLEGDEVSATIKRLTPSTTYYFKVQARNSRGYGPLSETVIYKTPKADGSGGGHINPEYPRRIDDKIPTHDNISRSASPKGKYPNISRHTIIYQSPEPEGKYSQHPITRWYTTVTQPRR